MKKIGIVILPVITLILETLPFGAVLIFAPSPTERKRETYSYFSLKPYGYANFAPFITGLFTCALLILGILVLVKANQKIIKIIFITAILAVITSLAPLILGLDYYTVLGGVITVTLVFEVFFCKSLMR